MTKLRKPESIEAACIQAVALLGSDAISDALRVLGLSASPSLIAKWGDPDAPQTPSFLQVRAMEMLLVKSGHAPVFVELLKGEAIAPVASQVDPVQAAIQATIDAAAMLKTVRDAVQDGSLQVHEVAGIKAKLTAMQKALGELNRTLVVKRRQ